MANPKIYTEDQIEAIKAGLNHYFPFEVGDATQQIFVNDTWSDPGKNFKWRGRDDYFTTLSDITDVQSLKDIKKAADILYGYETTTEAPKYEAPSTTISPNLEGLIEKLDKKETARKEIINENEQEVRASIKRQQEIYKEQTAKIKAAEAKIKDSVYYKVEKTPFEKVQEVKNLEVEAPLDPRASIEEASSQFEKSPVLQNMSQEEAKIVATQAAITTYEVSTDNSPIVQAAIINKIINSPELLSEIAPDTETQTIFKNAALDIADQKIAQFELSKQLAQLNKIDGVSSIEDVKVFISSTPQEGFQEFNLKDQIMTPAAENFAQQSRLFENLKGLGEGEIKSQILSNTGIRLESYIAGLPINSPLAKAYNLPSVQFGLKYLGVAPTSFPLEGSLLGKAITGSGLGQVASKAGINLGAKLVTKIGATTATKATATGLGALIGSVPGAIIASVGTFIATNLPKIKNFIEKNKDFLLVGGVGTMVAGALTGSIPLIVGGMFPTLLGGSSVISGGGFGSIGTSFFNGIGGIFGALGSATLGAIGVPILVTFLVFPIVVTLILFIINSGAYVVPPAPRNPLSGNVITSPYIDVIKKPIPSGPFENSDLPLTVEYQIEVRAKKGPLQNVKIEYNCSVIKKDSSTVCPDPEPEVPTAVEGGISPAKPFTFSYKETYNAANYADSFITDVITVTADSPEQTGAQAAGSATIKIGNPPEDCPAMWPTSSGGVTQGAYTGSHRILEAIDIGVSSVPVLATHTGVVVSSQSDSCYGTNVKIKSNCGGKEFYSRYAHLEDSSVKAGQKVTMGQTIGLSGNTTGGVPSCSTAPHLHYHFSYTTGGSPGWPKSPPYMMKSYIPQDVPRGCTSRQSCGVSW